MALVEGNQKRQNVSSLIGFFNKCCSASVGRGGGDSGVGPVSRLVFSIHVILMDGLVERSALYWPLARIVTPPSLLDRLTKKGKAADVVEMCVRWIYVLMCDGILSSTLGNIVEDRDLLTKKYSSDACMRDVCIVDVLGRIERDIEAEESTVFSCSCTCEEVTSAVQERHTEFVEKGISVLNTSDEQLPSGGVNDSNYLECNDCDLSSQPGPSCEASATESSGPKTKHGSVVSGKKEFSLCCCQAVTEQTKTEEATAGLGTRTNFLPSVQSALRWNGNHSRLLQLARPSTDECERVAMTDDRANCNTLGCSLADTDNSIHDAINDWNDLLDEEIYARMGLTRSIVELSDGFSNFMGFTAEEELINSINACKARVLEPGLSGKEQLKLVQLLTSLRWKLYSCRNKDSVSLPDSAPETQGHLFVKKNDPRAMNTLESLSQRRRLICESCHKRLFKLFSEFRLCLNCRICVHELCPRVTPLPCVSSDVNSISINFKICPEVGLSKQGFRCGFCKALLSSGGEVKGREATRRCDYSGLYYCSFCHTGDLHMIPARIVRNWDFTEYQVSRRAYNVLEAVWNKSLLNLLSLGKTLISTFPELRKIQAKRRRLCVADEYVRNCKFALKENVYGTIRSRMHLLRNDAFYTLQDLSQTHDGSLYVLLSRLERQLLSHIEERCSACRDRGHFCSICLSQDVIFKFNANSISCRRCDTVYHVKCFDPENCPTCARLVAYQSKLNAGFAAQSDYK